LKLTTRASALLQSLVEPVSSLLLCISAGTTTAIVFEVAATYEGGAAVAHDGAWSVVSEWADGDDST